MSADFSGYEGYTGPVCLRWNGTTVPYEFFEKNYAVEIIPPQPGTGGAYLVASLVEEFEINLDVTAPGGLPIRVVIPPPHGERIYSQNGGGITIRMNQQTHSYAPHGDGRDIANQGPVGVAVAGGRSAYVHHLGIAVGQYPPESGLYPPVDVQGNYGHLNVGFLWYEPAGGYRPPRPDADGGYVLTPAQAEALRGYAVEIARIITTVTGP